eukprot:8719037-Karenia_brevis.AAC.1
MRNFSSGGRKSTSLSDATKVFVAIAKFCTNGSIYGEEFRADVMYAVQLATFMPKSPLYLMTTAFDKYCKTHSSDENDIPSDFRDFLVAFEAKFESVSKRTKDIDDVGFVKKGIAYYTTFNVKELLMFIDDVFKYRVSFSDEDFDGLPCLPDVHVFAPSDLQLTISKEAHET